MPLGTEGAVVTRFKQRSRHTLSLGPRIEDVHPATLEVVCIAREDCELMLHARCRDQAIDDPQRPAASFPCAGQRTPSGGGWIRAYG